MASIENEHNFIEQSFPEQHHSVDQQNNLNSIVHIETSSRIFDTTDNMSRQQMKQSGRFRFFCSKHRTFMIAVRITLFVIISMTVGILTVCFTAQKRSSQTCAFTLKSINQNALSDDSHPKSLAAYDFNNDKKLDIAVANSGTNSIGIFLGKGDGTFSNQVTYPTGTDSQPSSVAVGDFNNDHDLDIVVANYGENNIGILFGNGDGTFTNQTFFSTGSSRPLCVAVGDFNNDSRLDIVLVNYGTNNIGVVFGYGNGNFTSQIIISADYDSLPFSAVVGDFNNDDKLDIAVANSGTDNIVIFLGDGNGTFPIQTTSSTGIGSQPHIIAIADLNHDTKLDIVVANYGADNVCVLFGYGNGSFVMQGTYSTGINSKPISVVIGDFNNDNRLDIAVSNTNANNVGIFLGYGDGTFANQTSFSTGSSSKPYFVVGGDFNSDSRLDIAVANYDANNVDILLSYPTVTLSRQETYSTGLNSQPSSVAVGDFNNDRRLDIVVANIGNSNIGIFMGNGDGTFASQTTYSIGDNSYQLVIAVGDFNNDSLLDIVVIFIDDNGGQVGVLLGNSDGIFSNLTAQIFSSYYSPLSIAVGDFNNDRRLDIVVCDGNGNIAVLLGYGNGNFTIPFFIENYSTSSSVAIGDFNNDTQLDIAVADIFGTSYPLSDVGVLLGHGDGTFSNQMTFPTGYNAQTQSVAVGDFNKDSRLDLVVTNLWNNNVGILLGYGNGTFSPQQIYGTGYDSNPTFVAVGDFSNDNQSDILFGNRIINGVGVLHGYGNGSFSNQMIYRTGTTSPPKSVALGDFNNDTLLDIVVTNSNDTNVGVLLGLAKANFVGGVTLSAESSSGPRCIVVGDFNRDSQLDFAVADYITNNVEVFLGDGSGSFPIQMLYSTGPFSSPTSVTVDDFNNDRQLDIAVANSGTDKIGVFFANGNGTFGSQLTYSIADGSSPQSIASGDFNKDYRSDIVVSNYGNDNVGVLLRYDSGRFGIEILYSAGDNSDPHAIAVGDFNNDRRLDIAVANNGNGNGHGNVGIFIGNDDGTFSSVKIYSTNDTFYPVAVTVGDFNHDTLLDIAAVDNANFRMHIFLGNGDGTFSDSTSYSTGYGSWPGSIAVADFNNDTLLDIVLGNYQTNNVGIFLGINNGTFSEQRTYQTGNGPGLTSVAVGDFNNDGRIDVAVANIWTNTVGILLGNGDGNFSNQVTYPTGTNSLPFSIAVGDFDKDSRLDIVVANKGADNIGVFFGYGNGSFSDQVTFSTGSGSQPASVVVGDFNNDGRLDIAVANSLGGSVGVILGYVNGIFFSQTTYSTSYNALPIFVVVGDFNNDSRLDIAVCNEGSNNIGIFLGYADESFLSLPSYLTGPSSRPTYVAVGDLNNDTRLDIAVANYLANNVMILLGSGYGTFTSEMTYATGNGSQPCWIAIGDLNNDSRLDIVVANSGNDNIGVFIGYGNGTFSSQITYSTGVRSQPSSVTIGDFNNDTRLDIAVANYGSNNVGLLFGDGNGSFAIEIPFSAGFDSRPLALASGDVNNDNVSDIIIANNGYGDIDILSKRC